MVAECKQTMSSDGQPVARPWRASFSSFAPCNVYSLELGSHAPQQQNILQSLENVFPRIKFILSHHRFRFVFRKPFHATFSQRIKRFVNNLKFYELALSEVLRIEFKYDTYLCNIENIL